MTRSPRITRRSALKTGAIAAGVASVGTRIGVADDDESSSDDHCYYQVDFVTGDPIEILGVNDDDFYGRQNRLIQYVHADGDEVIERDTWINSLDPEVRRCVTAEPIQIREGTASVEFTVADGCERTFSLAVYPLPGGEFSFAGLQALAAATTETVGPGTHELTVEDARRTVCPPLSNGYEQLAKLVADVEPGAGFGISIGVSDSGDTAVIGAPGDDPAGSAHVFTRTDGTWTQQAKLIADDAGERDAFGLSVGVSGSDDTAVIGGGGTYVFGRTDGAWTQRTKLTGFGGSVAVSDSGETAVVGRPDDDTDAGSAYVFGRTDGTWTQRAKLTAADAGEYDSFGDSVAVSGSGETAVVGASDDDTDVGERSGSAYVFTRTDGTWTQQAKLTAPDAAEQDYFGGSVAVSGSGDTAVVGAWGAGSAYVFSRANGTWTPRAKLIADDRAGGYYGESVAVSGSGDTVVVGARGDGTGARFMSGAAYVFGRTDGVWTQRGKLVAADAEVSDQLGRSVAVSGSGETVVAGAFYDDTDAADDSGSAYVFGQ